MVLFEMKKFKSVYYLLGVIFLSINVNADVVDCGIVTIEKVLTGPRHGAMMQLNKVCGKSVWVCLDPDAEHMSENESERLFSFVLASTMATSLLGWRLTKTHSLLPVEVTTRLFMMLEHHKAMLALLTLLKLLILDEKASIRVGSDLFYPVNY